jgi:hypothetical protein
LPRRHATRCSVRAHDIWVHVWSSARRPRQEPGARVPRPAEPLPRGGCSISGTAGRQQPPHGQGNDLLAPANDPTWTMMIAVANHSRTWRPTIADLQRWHAPTAWCPSRPGMPGPATRASPPGASSPATCTAPAGPAARRRTPPSVDRSAQRQHPDARPGRGRRAPGEDHRGPAEGALELTGCATPGPDNRRPRRGDHAPDGCGRSCDPLSPEDAGARPLGADPADMGGLRSLCAFRDEGRPPGSPSISCETASRRSRRGRWGSPGASVDLGPRLEPWPTQQQASGSGVLTEVSCIGATVIDLGDRLSDTCHGSSRSQPHPGRRAATIAPRRRRHLRCAWGSHERHGRHCARSFRARTRSNRCLLRGEAGRTTVDPWVADR